MAFLCFVFFLETFSCFHHGSFYIAINSTQGLFSYHFNTCLFYIMFTDKKEITLWTWFICSYLCSFICHLHALFGKNIYPCFLTLERSYLLFCYEVVCVQDMYERVTLLSDMECAVFLLIHTLPLLIVSWTSKMVHTGMWRRFWGGCGLSCAFLLSWVLSRCPKHHCQSQCEISYAFCFLTTLGF